MVDYEHCWTNFCLEKVQASKMCQNPTDSKINAVDSASQQKKGFETSDIVWRNVILMLYIHASGLYAFFLILTGKVIFSTIAFQLITGYLASFGVTAGTHRLWSHKCYKAKLPLKIILAVLQTMACQNSIHEWSRDHRVHHKFTETNADPHNAKRGFFFSHVGWLLAKKHDDVKIKGKGVFMADLEADPVVMFQKKYFPLLTLIACFWMPWYVPVRFWGEDPWLCWNTVLWRYMLLLNFTWCVNSVAHLWGEKPYDKNINPVETKLVSILTGGEGWHNYHHTFPWDYKAAELPTYTFNWSTGFIDFFAWIGWAYDLKTVPEKMVLQRIQRTGDGSHPTHVDKLNFYKESHSQQESSNMSEEVSPAWGWDDENMKREDKEITLIFNRSG